MGRSFGADQTVSRRSENIFVTADDGRGGGEKGVEEVDWGEGWGWEGVRTLQVVGQQARHLCKRFDE